MDNNKLMEEQKELQSKYEELDKKYQEVMQQKKSKNWDEWNKDDVVNAELSKNVAAEGINSQFLADLERNDLHRIGIIQFKDKKTVYNDIQELVN